MENMENMNELEEMRQELQALKNKVERKGVLNERLVRKYIQDKMNDIRRTLYKLIVVVLLAIPLWIFIKYTQHLSWPLTIFTILMMVVSIASDWCINRVDVGSIGEDLKVTANRLVEMKKRRSLREKIGCLVVLPIWALWVGYEFYQNAPDHDSGIIMLVSMAIGGVIGGAAGLSIFYRWQRKNDEMIEQINNLMEEE